MVLVTAPVVPKMMVLELVPPSPLVILAFPPTWMLKKSIEAI